MTESKPELKPGDLIWWWPAYYTKRSDYKYARQAVYVGLTKSGRRVVIRLPCNQIRFVTVAHRVSRRFETDFHKDVFEVMYGEGERQPSDATHIRR